MKFDFTTEVKNRTSGDEFIVKWWVYLTAYDNRMSKTIMVTDVLKDGELLLPSGMNTIYDLDIESEGDLMPESVVLDSEGKVKYVGFSG